MWCEKVLALVTSSGDFERFFVIRPHDFDADSFAHETLDRLGIPREKLPMLSISGSNRPSEMALLISIDRNTVLLTEVSKEGEVNIPKGGRLVSFSSLPYPVEGDPEKFWSAYDRDVYSDPIKMQALGYSSDSKEYKILQRWDISKYAELELLEPPSRFTLEKMPNYILIWLYLFGEESRERFGFYAEDIRAELGKRLVDIEALRTNEDYHWLDEAFCLKNLGFWELDARKLRLETLVRQVSNLWSSVDCASKTELEQFTKNVEYLITDLDAALDLYAYFGLGQEIHSEARPNLITQCLAEIWAKRWDQSALWTYEADIPNNFYKLDWTSEDNEPRLDLLSPYLHDRRRKQWFSDNDF